MVMGMGAAAIGCDNKMPQGAVREQAISTAISEAASTAIATSEPHSEVTAKSLPKPSPQPDIGKPCPDLGVIKSVCGSLPEKLKVTGDPAKRTSECISIRAAMGKRFGDFMACVGEVQAYNQPQCMVEQSPGKLTDKEVEDTKVIAKALSNASAHLAGAREAVTWHNGIYCEGKNMVPIVRNGREIKTPAHQLISEIITTSNTFMAEGVRGVNTRPKGDRNNLFAPQ